MVDSFTTLARNGYMGNNGGNMLEGGNMEEEEEEDGEDGELNETLVDDPTADIDALSSLIGEVIVSVTLNLDLLTLILTLIS